MARPGHARRLGSKSDLDLLEPYILDKESAAERCRSSAIPTRRRIWRLELFFNAMALSIERATGVMVSPMHEDAATKALAAWC